MILADSSVWIDHLRSADRDLERVIGEGELLVHPFVIAELALGSIPNRAPFFEALGKLERAATLDDEGLLRFVEDHELFATGLSMVDAHLLASAAITPNIKLWTRDKRLNAQARRLGLDYSPA